MRRVKQSCTGLDSWLESHGVQLFGVEVRPTSFGSGLMATKEVVEGNTPLLQVPASLVLSEKYVWKHAETDRHLRDCLEALEEFTQISATSPDMSIRIGVENPWTTYVQYLPDEENLPTFWTEGERRLCMGTTLEPALEAKIRSLRREYEQVEERLGNIAWCQEHWFSKGQVTFEDWRIVDAIYRSRGMEILSHGSCMVPIADMVNHGHGAKINARSDVEESSGDVRLVFDQISHMEAAGGRLPSSVKVGEQVMMSYGEEKGACEMLFSYGFIDADMARAESIFLGLQDPEDDPIFQAKKYIFDCAPGVRISFMTSSELIKWIGPYVWLMCVNEEDGLDLRVEEQTDGSKKLVAAWKEKPVQNVVELDQAIRSDDMYDLFDLRASVVIHERIKSELAHREAVLNDLLGQEWWREYDRKSAAWKNCKRLRSLEYDMLKAASDHFNTVIGNLYTSKTVQRFFNGTDSEDMWESYKNGDDPDTQSTET